MKTTKKVLAVILLVVLVSAIASGLTQLLFNEWKIGFAYTLAFYAGIAALALFGAMAMLFNYIFKD